MVKKVEMGNRNTLELEERAGLDPNQRLTEAYSGKSCQRSCRPNFSLVQGFPSGYLLFEVF